MIRQKTPYTIPLKVVSALALFIRTGLTCPHVFCFITTYELTIIPLLHV